jgi:hypothetical protein
MDTKKPKGTFAKLMASPLPLPQPQSPVREHQSVEKTGNEKTSLHANQQTNKDASMQTSKQVNQFTNLHANQQTSKDASMLSTKEKRKYSTYLTEETVLAIQMKAIQTKRKDHEIVQEAIDRYFESE